MAGTRASLPFNGAKLLAARARLGLRQQDLSDRTARVGRRIERATISRYENGEASPSALNFGALVEVLGCRPADLLDDEKATA